MVFLNRKEKYADLDRWRETCREQKKRYYAQSECGRSRWTPPDDDLVMAKEMPDTQLAAKIGHSVRAIQLRRAKLNKIAREEDKKARE